MAELSRFNSTVRFTGLSDIYAKYRPGYPVEALDFICSRCGLRDDSVLVDVGCGTGISSRQFAARGYQVIGIEPNAEMRAGEQRSMDRARRSRRRRGRDRRRVR